MTDFISTILLIILAIIICIVLYFVFKNGVKLFINALCGVVILFVVSFFHLAPIGALSLPQVIVCAVGGVIGAVLLIVLSFFGIVI